MASGDYLKSLIGKKKLLCVPPKNKLVNFDKVLKQVGKLPVIKNGVHQTITTNYKNDGQSYRLSVKSTILQLGLKGGPVVIFLPWFGGKSVNLKRFISLKKHPSWTLVGIDVFDNPKGVDQILYIAEGTRRAYALVITMFTKLIEQARQEGRKVGAVGLSYGANIISAYLSRGLEAPDAIVAIEGGNILKTTLHGKWRNNQYDPRIIEALNKNPALIPLQTPTNGEVAAKSAAVINLRDKVVLDQDQTWQNAKTKLYINGTHFVAPILNQRKIHVLANTHLGNLLS